MDRGAIQKKQLIIEKAAEVFAEKGFLKVTVSVLRQHSTDLFGSGRAGNER